MDNILCSLISFFFLEREGEIVRNKNSPITYHAIHLNFLYQCIKRWFVILWLVNYTIIRFRRFFPLKEMLASQFRD